MICCPHIHYDVLFPYSLMTLCPHIHWCRVVFILTVCLLSPLLAYWVLIFTNDLFCLSSCWWHLIEIGMIYFPCGNLILSSSSVQSDFIGHEIPLYIQLKNSPVSHRDGQQVAAHHNDSGSNVFDHFVLRPRKTTQRNGMTFVLSQWLFFHLFIVRKTQFKWLWSLSELSHYWL